MDLRDVIFMSAMARDTLEEKQKVEEQMWEALSGKRMCCVCGYEQTRFPEEKDYNSVTGAHILRSQYVYVKIVQLAHHEPINNVIPLCGTAVDDVHPLTDESYRGRKSCHSMFANYEMSFVPDGHVSLHDRERWVVVGGPFHNDHVTLITKPHASVMFEHTRVHVKKKKSTTSTRIEKWQKGIHDSSTPIDAEETFSVTPTSTTEAQS